MVIQRTIENLKERPREERRAVASMIALSVIGVLLLVWAISFLFRIGDLSAPDTSQIGVSSDNEQSVGELEAAGQ